MPESGGWGWGKRLSWMTARLCARKPVKVLMHGVKTISTLIDSSTFTGGRAALHSLIAQDSTPFITAIARTPNDSPVKRQFCLAAESEAK